MTPAYAPQSPATDNSGSVMGPAQLAAFFKTHAKALGPYGVSVALLLAANADATGRVEMSHQQIGEALAVSRRHVMRVTAELVRGGFIRQERSSTKPSVWWVLSDAYAPQSLADRIGGRTA